MATALATVDFAIPEEEVQLTSTILGEGGFATVYKAIWKGAVVAVKCTSIRAHSHRDRADPASTKESEELLAALDVFREEAKVSCGLLHPLIVRLFGVYAPDTRHVGLVIELMETSLRSRVKKDPPLATPCIVHVLHDMTSALSYLHSRSILHRDISPRNTLLSKDSAHGRLIAKLSDFATAKAVETIGFDCHSTREVGTLSYLPSEAIDKDPVTDKLVYSSAVDVYSVGAVGLFSVLRKDPGGTPVAKPKYLEHVGANHVLYGVLKKCLEDDPRKRPSSVQLVADLERVGGSKECTCSGSSGSANAEKFKIAEMKQSLADARLQNKQMKSELEQCSEKLKTEESRVALLLQEKVQLEEKLAANDKKYKGYLERAKTVIETSTAEKVQLEEKLAANDKKYRGYLERAKTVIEISTAENQRLKEQVKQSAGEETRQVFSMSSPETSIPPLQSQCSSQDADEYLCGYPGKKDYKSLRQNLLFYTNQIPSVPNGDFVDNIHVTWWGNYQLLEVHHGYIEWLFPIRESGVNQHAQELQLHEAQAICADKEAHRRVLRSYQMMLDFYGMELVDEKTGEIKRSPLWRSRFSHLNRSNHHYRCITRILKCLGEMNYEHLQAPFVQFCTDEAFKIGTLTGVQCSLSDCWVHIIKDTRARENLIAEIEGYTELT